MNHSLKRQQSVLAMMRLMIGNMDRDPPNDEEIEIMKTVVELISDLHAALDRHQPKLLTASVATVQLLEDLLCEYKEEMPQIVTAVTCKLSHHGAQHINGTEDEIIESMPLGTIH